MGASFAQFSRPFVVLLFQLLPIHYQLRSTYNFAKWLHACTDTRVIHSQDIRATLQTFNGARSRRVSRDGSALKDISKKIRLSRSCNIHDKPRIESLQTRRSSIRVNAILIISCSLVALYNVDSQRSLINNTTIVDLRDFNERKLTSLNRSRNPLLQLLRRFTDA